MASVVPVKIILYLRSLSSRYGIGQLDKKTEVDIFPFNPDIGLPFASFFMKTYAAMSACIGGKEFHILRVFAGSNLPKVLNPIVESISIDMINFNRPITKVHRQDHAMSREGQVEYSSASVSVTPDRIERKFPRIPLIPRRAIGSGPIPKAREVLLASLAPIQQPAIRVVFKKLVKNAWCDLISFHAQLSHTSNQEAMEVENA